MDMLVSSWQRVERERSGAFTSDNLRIGGSSVMSKSFMIPPHMIWLCHRKLDAIFSRQRGSRIPKRSTMMCFKSPHIIHSSLFAQHIESALYNSGSYKGASNANGSFCFCRLKLMSYAMDVMHKRAFSLRHISLAILCSHFLLLRALYSFY